jgi:hypothetical protein
MNAEQQTRPTRFPFFRRCLRMILNRKVLYAFAALITLWALYCAEENFRGKRAWDRYRKSAEARGVVLDHRTYVTPPIPDSENGAGTPFIQSWFPGVKDDLTNRWPAKFYEANKAVENRRPAPGGQDNRGYTDLVAWQQAFAKRSAGPRGAAHTDVRFSTTNQIDPVAQSAAALAVLSELEVYAPVLEELRAASVRPKFRYPVEYNTNNPFAILLPHMAQVKALVQELRLQVSAELAAGQTDRAFADLRLMMWLCDSLNDETFLISQLVRIACQQILSQPLWEGLAQHKWSEAQLKEIQVWFLKTDFTDAMTRSMATERAGGAAVIQNLIHRRNLAETLNVIDPSDAPPGFPHPGTKFFAWLTPRGWLYFELVNQVSMLDGLMESGWESETRTFSPARLDLNEAKFKGQLRPGISAVWHHQVFAQLLLPALTKAASRAARGQSTANQAAIACAIERYRLANGTLPENLFQLVPQFIAKIPNEAVSTEPMRYRREGNGYVLYSAGWDGNDDKGAFLGTIDESKPDSGDWVWKMP